MNDFVGSFWWVYGYNLSMSCKSGVLLSSVLGSCYYFFKLAMILSWVTITSILTSRVASNYFNYRRSSLSGD